MDDKDKDFGMDVVVSLTTGVMLSSMRDVLALAGHVIGGPVSEHMLADRKFTDVCMQPLLGLPQVRAVSEAVSVTMGRSPRADFSAVAAVLGAAMRDTMVRVPYGCITNTPDPRATAHPGTREGRTPASDPSTPRTGGGARSDSSVRRAALGSVLPWWRSARLVAIDIETTGLNYEDGHRVVDLAAVVVQGDAVDRWSVLVNPGRPIPPEATAIHGITDEAVADAPQIGQVAVEFCELVRSADVLVTYNGAWFDVPFLDATCPGFVGARADKPHVDVIVMVRDVGRYWSGKGRHKLTSVCERYRVPMRGDAHRASTDALATVEVMQWLLDGREATSPEVLSTWCETEGAQQRQAFDAWLARQAKAED